MGLSAFADGPISFRRSKWIKSKKSASSADARARNSALKIWKSAAAEHHHSAAERNVDPRRREDRHR